MIKKVISVYLIFVMHILFLSWAWIGGDYQIIKYSYALQPPRPGEIEELEKRGILQSRIEYAREVGNYKIDNHLFKTAISNLKRNVLQSKGMNLNEVDNIAPLPAPPLGWSTMPSTGNIKIFGLLIDFNDYPHVNSKEDIHNKIFGEGNPENFPYESVKNYYSRSSYGVLNFTEGATLGWYRHNGNRSDIQQTTPGRDNLIKEALNYFNSQGHDFSQYDNDGDGYIDYFLVIWSGPVDGFSGFWWGLCHGFSDNNFLLDGKRFRKYAWLWENQYGDPADIKTMIHETGHALGLPDYYDYNYTIGPGGGVGGLDILAEKGGDHNSFSKWVLGWITPTLVSNGAQILTLSPSGTSPDAIIIWPGIAEGDIFSEFFIIQNRYRIGNDKDYPNDGLLIWHVNASLNYDNDNFLYDNSYTSHKLLRLMEADGLEEIEGDIGGYASNAGDYYTSGKILGPCTVPSSKGYNGGDSYVEISNIFMNGQQINAVFDASRVESCGRTLVVNKSGSGTGGVVSAGRNCTNYPCTWRYGQGFMVTLRPEEDPGSSFVKWSGCDDVKDKSVF